jgi:hypothetical protein
MQQQMMMRMMSLDLQEGAVLETPRSAGMSL